MRRFDRQKLFIGEENFNKLKNVKVMIIGLGGVGSFALEAIARAGIGSVCLIDGDKIDITNINRQLLALDSTVGEYKVEVAKKRVYEINPGCQVTAIKDFIDSDNLSRYITRDIDYIIDAIDMISAKIDLICYAKDNGINIISSMGTGNKLFPEMLKADDIFKTAYDPIARVLRKELKKRGVKELSVIYSTEQTPIVNTLSENGANKTGSISTVPASAGFLLASRVIFDIINNQKMF